MISVEVELDFRLELESRVKGQRKSQSPSMTVASAAIDVTSWRDYERPLVKIGP